MNEVLELIEKKKEEFVKIEFFQFMQDKSIDPRTRLAWTPCFAPLSITFGELNKYVLRKEPTNNPVQDLINKHTYEDDHHWIWLLEDIEKLGLNRTLKLNDALKFIWSEETQKIRMFSYEMYAMCTYYNDPILNLVFIESVEATGNVGQSIILEVAKELQSITKQEYRFWGENHLSVEQGHTTGMDDVVPFLENIHITEQQKEIAFELVERVFEGFSQSLNEMMVYAQKYSSQESFALA